MQSLDRHTWSRGLRQAAQLFFAVSFSSVPYFVPKKMFLRLIVFLCLILLNQALNSFSRLPPINHCNEIVVRNFMPERIPSVLTEIFCEITTNGTCGPASRVIKNFGVKIQIRWLKITEKVSFNIASEASYVYILSGQKFIKNAKNWSILANFRKP